MAIHNTNVIDRIVYDHERKAMIYIIEDSLGWDVDHGSKTEIEHLILLRNKICAYIRYMKLRKLKECYPEMEMAWEVISIHFQYGWTNNCLIFLDTVQAQIKNAGIILEYRYEEKTFVQ